MLLHAQWKDEFISSTCIFLYKVPNCGLAGGHGAFAAKSLGSERPSVCIQCLPGDPTPPGNWPPSAFDGLAYLVIYWVHVKIKWVKILLFKQQGKEHQKGVHFISRVLIKSSMK